MPCAPEAKGGFGASLIRRLSGIALLNHTPSLGMDPGEKITSLRLFTISVRVQPPFPLLTIQSRRFSRLCVQRTHTFSHRMKLQKSATPQVVIDGQVIFLVGSHPRKPTLTPIETECVLVCINTARLGQTVVFGTTTLPFLLLPTCGSLRK